MNTPGILPQPASARQLLLDAAKAWPDGVATPWFPDPPITPRRLAWSYADPPTSWPAPASQKRKSPPP